MEDNFEQLQRFFTACDELVRGSYLQAEPRIADVLKAVAASPALVRLFGAVTEGYDFPAAKSAYLRASGNGTAAGIAALLPSERSEVLAYVFCLLVELDAGAMRFPDFLLRYFHVDGSYTASYSVFADRIIRPFRDIVRDCFPDFSVSGRAAIRRKKREELFGEIEEQLSAERARLLTLSLPEEDAAGGGRLLAAAGSAAGRRDAEELLALLTGYKYFLRSVGGDEGACGVFALAEEL